MSKTRKRRTQKFEVLIDGEFYALVIVGPNPCSTARKADGGITPTMRAREVLAEVGANREWALAARGPFGANRFGNSTVTTADAEQLHWPAEIR